MGKVCACMVVLHPDGSVVLTHGAIEMGQALHTKLNQICAEALGVPFENVCNNNIS
jgi:xanthine dehydrogenase molybdopterin-binding subunit B